MPDGVPTVPGKGTACSGAGSQERKGTHLRIDADRSPGDRKHGVVLVHKIESVHRPDSPVPACRHTYARQKLPRAGANASRSACEALLARRIAAVPRWLLPVVAHHVANQQIECRAQVMDRVTRDRTCGCRQRSQATWPGPRPPAPRRGRPIRARFAAWRSARAGAIAPRVPAWPSGRRLRRATSAIR